MSKRETLRELYARIVQEQREWIRLNGGNLLGYIAKYGSADDPHRTGNGGEAIYRADTNALAKYEARLERERRNRL